MTSPFPKLSSCACKITSSYLIHELIFTEVHLHWLYHIKGVFQMWKMVSAIHFLWSVYFVVGFAYLLANKRHKELPYYSNSCPIVIGVQVM